MVMIFPSKTSIVFFRHWLLYALVNIVARAVYIYDHLGLVWEPLVLLQALGSDIAIGIFPAALATALFCIHRHLPKLILLSWCILLISNREFILAHGINIPFLLTKEGMEAEFIIASTLHKRYLAGLFLITCFAFITDHFLSKFFREKNKEPLVKSKALLLCLILATANLFFHKVDYSLAWTQTHVLHENLASYGYGWIDSTQPNNLMSAHARNMYHRTFSKNLSGQRIISPQPNQNILIVTIEGLSQSHMERGWLPHLKEIARHGWHYKNVVNSGVITINGLRAMLCGEPTFKHHNAIELVERIEILQSRCLPTILKEHGYYTEFMQAAHLSYQKKDELSEVVGFDHAMGKGMYEYKIYANKWGLDDAGLYEEAKKRIKIASNKNQPWFIQTLSVSTHHPHIIPDHFIPIIQNTVKTPKADMTDHELSFRFADYSVYQLIEWLKEQGYLENTLVIITGDESSARNQTQTLLDGYIAHYHGLLIMIGASLDTYTQDKIVLQTDTGISILDYLGIAEEAPIIGRSVFREYRDQRPIIFGNSYIKHSCGIYQPGTLVCCNRVRIGCTTHQYITNNFFTKPALKNSVLMTYETSVLKKLLLDIEEIENDTPLRH